MLHKTNEGLFVYPLPHNIPEDIRGGYEDVDALPEQLIESQNLNNFSVHDIFSDMAPVCEFTSVSLFQDYGRFMALL